MKGRSKPEPAPGPPVYRIGADIGGTFTDLVMTGPGGRVWTRKVLSTPDDYSVAIVEGVKQMLAEAGAEGDAVQEVVHGTTVATNAILENRGAKTALITTKGFRDVLELRRLRVPELFSLFYVPPKPLVERRLRLEADERLDAQGAVLRPLDEDTVHAALDRIESDGAEAVAVCLLHSYRNGSHERRVGEIVRRRLPGAFVSLSVDVLPEIREYERTSTTVVNAYIGPLVKKYLGSLEARLAKARVAGRLRIMQSNGGVMSAAAAAAQPAYIVESGPAAGVVGAHRAALEAGEPDVISFDMGGTTAKASLIEGGKRTWTTEYEVGAGIQLSSKLVKGRGHAVRLPVLDIAEVGAGGGSIVWVDRGGALKVGPQSAGAAPGPACYGQGGVEPTVTDANVVLGYVSPESLAGGAVAVRADLAAKVIGDRVARPTGMGLAEAAHGVHTVANATMIRALKAVSTYRGRDPREFTLFAFGGNGPVHAAALAESLGISRVMVPPSPGLFSAVGMLGAEPERHFVQTIFGRGGEITDARLAAVFNDMEQRAKEEIGSEGYSLSQVRWRRRADLRYAGQAFELTVDVPSAPRRIFATLASRFHAEHLRTYGHNSPGEEVELVNLRLTATVRTGSAPGSLSGRHIQPQERSSPDARRSGPSVRRGAGRAVPARDAFFGSTAVRTPVVSREDVASRSEGPIIIEEYDATTVVPPGWAAALDERLNIVIESQTGRRRRA
jgi:N-methylhydantoinase A